MRIRDRISKAWAFAAAGFVVGLTATALWSAELIRASDLPRLPVQDLTRLDAVRVLPRAELLLLTTEARSHLEAGRPWSAWRLMRENMEDPINAPAAAVLVAAEAAGEWGGWAHVEALLKDQPWLDRADDRLGRYLLARAAEEQGERTAAIASYRRYLEAPGADLRGIALARMGALLRAAGDSRGAAAAFAEARTELPQIRDWMLALEAEQLARSGDPRAAAVAREGSAGSAPVRLRRVQAEAASLSAAGDLATAVRRVEWEAQVLRSQRAHAEAARLQLDRAGLLREMGREAEARELLRTVAWEGTAPADVRETAAARLAEFGGRTAAEELARSAALEAAGKPGLAARALRAAISAGAPDDGGLRLRLARLLYAERDYGPGRDAFLEAADRLSEPELVADARLHAARALFRSGSRNRSAALAEIRQVAERYPGTAAAGTAHFLLGDEAATIPAALAHYRVAAGIQHSPDAREALFRIGDRSLKQGDRAGAIRAWEEYVRRYPRGDQTARVAYETGKLHEALGRTGEARALYSAAIDAEPVSYYAIRATNRLGLDPLDRALREPRPWPGLATDPVEAGSVLRRLDALRSVGLTEEWSAELDAAMRTFAGRPAALLVLGEGLRDRNHPLEGIRIGYRLLEARGGEWDERLLRLVFPFPYRELLTEEARRARVDPYLLAGLVRQESTFRPAVRSWVGATGLGQIMPATGRWLAPSVGIRAYEEKLLEVPEVNLRMSAKYLGDLLRRYDGARDLALAGYNAGPGRADRWRRTLGHGGDVDAFRERIPFDETRDYVKLVLRNAAVYERLYGGVPAPGLVRRPD